MFRTNKCTHGDKAMCINCLVNKNKIIGNQPQEDKKNLTIAPCKHPPQMKCLRCLPKQEKLKKCQHPDYEKCKECQWLIRYEKFCHYLQKLNFDCPHKRPCEKCQPPLSKKNYFIDKTCRKHIPYPQAQCDSCMAPTLTVCPQKYAHVSRVVIKTTAIYRITDANLFGILLGRVCNDVVFVQDVYFPAEQEAGSSYINPDLISNNSHIWQYLNLKQVGLLYHSKDITGLGLMISSMFQERYLDFEDCHQVSKFITMRLHLGTQQGSNPHFQCFMVSDQLQAFHKNQIIYQKESHQNYFDLITAKNDNLSELPTFLREGIQTDKLYFRQALVWIETISQENFISESLLFQYPYYKLDVQTFDNFKQYVNLEADPLQKYRNIQFLLHLQSFIGNEGMNWFLNNYLPFDPDLFLRQKMTILQKIEFEKLKNLQGSEIYQSGSSYME